MKTKLMGLGVAAALSLGAATAVSAGSVIGEINSYGSTAQALDRAVVFQDNFFVWDPTNSGPVDGGLVQALFEIESLAVSGDPVPPLSDGLTADIDEASTAFLGIGIRGTAVGTIDLSTGLLSDVEVVLYGRDGLTPALSTTGFLSNATYAGAAGLATAAGDGWVELARFDDSGLNNYWFFDGVEFIVALSKVSQNPLLGEIVTLNIGDVDGLLGPLPDTDGAVYGKGGNRRANLSGNFVRFDSGTFAMSIVPTPAALGPGLALLALVAGRGVAVRRRMN